MSLLFIFLFIFWSNTASSQDYKVVSLYEGNALITGRLLPFKVRGPSKLEIIEVKSTNDCSIILDPYRKNIFHLFCKNEVVTELDIFLSSNSEMKKIVVRNVKISNSPVIASTRIIPIDQNEPEESLGKKIFKTDCMGCHPGLKIISKNQTSSTLRNALARGQMKDRGLHLLYNNDDQKINALKKYINEER